jgi:hypothetical protein
MDLKRKTAAAMAAMATVATGLVVGVSSPALAASTSCTAPYWYKPWYRTCTTGSINANSKHKISIYIDACEGSPWKVWDTGTGKTIASGTGNGAGINKSVGGLYGTYKAKLTDACWQDYISISS